MNIEELMNSRKRLEQFYKKELEKLYLWVMSGLEREDYLKLSEEEIADLFNHNIPDGWTYDKTTYPVDKKIQYLEAAICSNSSLLELEGIFHL